MKSILKVIAIILISLAVGAAFGRIGINSVVITVSSFLLLVALDESKIAKESISSLRN